METSPLATLHRPVSVPSWGNRDVYRPHALYANPSNGAGNMSLREQLHKSSSDYFNAKEVRGSSPAASLAADLSQNFRIDNDVSPQFPTPRRALFTGNMMGGVELRSYMTTPPLPSSSPADTTEFMEVSPLPHKPAFSTQIEVTSPTPISTPADDDDMMLDSPAPISRQSSLEPPSRRYAAPRRPSLSRMKGFTTSSIPARAQSEDRSTPFLFGSEDYSLHTGSNLSPSECFDTDSPPQERRPSSANSPCAPVPFGLRPRPQFASIGAGSRHGSPLAARGRSNPFLRNRKQFRRSLSMFENPAEVVKPAATSGEGPTSSLQCAMSVEETHEPALPHFMSEDPTDSIPRISQETLLDVLDGKYADSFDQRMVIDCRFEYEYEGGHIEGAVNQNDKELLASQLFQTPMAGKTLLIFHCEYSAHRAPMMARHVRSEDRTVNAEHYPRLTYPDVYILDGGYSRFFSDHRGRCFPQDYVEMSDEKHQRTCEREMGRLKSRKGLGRAQTFAFGSRDSCVDESPTAPGRPSSTMALGSIDHSPCIADRVHARRMASY